VTAVALAAHELSKRFRVGLSSRGAIVHAVESVSFAIAAGSTLGIVGESGCGKSTLGRMVAGLTPPSSGAVEIDGFKVSRPREIARDLRGRVQMVFQDPASSLDPRMRVGSSVGEPLIGIAGARRGGLVREMLARVGLPASAAESLPHQLSIGQRQRACIARALIGGQRVMVLDEVVSALDPIVRTHVLELLAQLQADRRLTYLFISHDLGAVRTVSTHVGVMYLGELVEYAPVNVFERTSLLHPYAVTLLSSRLEPRIVATRRAAGLKGEVPSPLDRPTGCVFRTRCPIAQAVCADRKPPLQEARRGHLVACHFPGEYH
jgi:oligopeptide/dipeptide ABC transporter ATP-binding protein